MSRRFLAAVGAEGERHALFWAVVGVALSAAGVPAASVAGHVPDGVGHGIHWLGMCLFWFRPSGRPDAMAAVALGLLAAGALRAGPRVARAARRVAGSSAAAVSDRSPAAARVRRLARAAGVRTPIRVVPCRRAVALTRGWWRPEIVISRCLARSLSDAELTAVLAHEACHAQNRDPLRRFVLRLVVEGLFFVPVLRRMADAYERRQELEADRRAVALQADWRPLGSALLKVLSGQTRCGAAAPAIGAVPEDAVRFSAMAEARIRQLMGPGIPGSAAPRPAASWPAALQAGASVASAAVLACAAICSRMLG